MNTFTKIVVSIILLISGVTALYAQSPVGKTEKADRKSVEYRPQTNVAFENSEINPFHHKSVSSQDGIIKPVKAVQYNPLTGYLIENPILKDNFFYDTTGMLVKEIRDFIPPKEIQITTHSNHIFPASICNNNREYNNHSVFYYCDTSTLYKSANMDPISRHYFEYETELAEDPYMERASQQWNKSKSRWDNIEKKHYTYLDTVSWYITAWELYGIGPDNTFRLLYRETDSLIYDENNNVYRVIKQATDFDIGLTGKMLYEYYYPESTHDNMTGYDSLYYYWEDDSLDDAWIVKGKLTDITWHRWDGFDYGSNYMSSFYGWYASKEEGKFDLWGEQKYGYDIDGIAGSRTDTICFYSNMYEQWYIKCAKSEIYNEQGDFCEDRYIEWRNIEETGGVPELRHYEVDSYVNEYNDDGLLWRTSNYYTSLTLGYEYLLFYIWEVTEFADVTIVTDITELPPSENQLLIAPNPASGAITISAAAEIGQFQIFDIVGRLVHSHTPASKEVVFDTGILEKGVYIVRALLKDGEVQTGKVVRN